MKVEALLPYADQRRYWRWLVAILALLVTLAGCASGPFARVADDVDACLVALPPITQEHVVTGVFVAPDDGHEPVIDEINASQCTVDIAVYLLSDDLVIEAIFEAIDRGVRVRVMLENAPFGGGGDQHELAAALGEVGIELAWSPSQFRFVHAKYIVVDQQVAVIMNQNLTASAFTSNREFGAITTDPDVVTHAQDIFNLDWSGVRGASLDGPLIVSPTTSRERFLALIDGTEDTIDLYAEVMCDPEIMEALATASDRGVRVRVLVRTSSDESDLDSYIALAADGAEVRISGGPYVHAKLLVLDGDVAVIGSQNFTANSLDNNREIAMVLDDPALLERCREVFERDWIRSSPGAVVSDE